MKIRTIANGMPLCKACAFKSYKEVSKAYRPRVQQWVVYEEAIVLDFMHIHCSKCGEEIHN